MSPTIISSPPNMPSTSINISPSSTQVPSSGTSASTATPTTIPSRRRSSVLTSTTAAPLIANTTVNPLASFLSNGTFRLPSAVASSSGPSRRTSSGVTNRRISSSSSDAGGSTDALLDLTGSLSSINRRSNLNLAAVAAGSGVSTSGSDGVLGEESGTMGAPSNARQWNNLSSVVQSISPLLPSSVLFQRAARRVMGSQNMGRLSGNRRSGPSSGVLTSSNSVDSSTMDRDDLLTLLSAMEEGVSDEPRPGTATTNTNTSPNVLPVQRTQCAGGGSNSTSISDATGNTDGCSSAGGGDSDTPVASVSGTSTTTTNEKDVEPMKTLSVSNLNTCDNVDPSVVDGESVRQTGAIPKTRQDSACVIDIGSDESETGKDSVDVGSSNKGLFGSLFSSLTGAGGKEEDSAQQNKSPVINSTADSKSKSNAQASHCVAVNIEGEEKSSSSNKKDDSLSSSEGDKSKVITSGKGGGEGSDSNDDVGGGGGEATNDNNNANDNNETNGNEETEENNEEEEETEETTPEDPYWTSVLWQLPVLLGMMLGKYLQYYFFDILAILSVAGLFHFFNVVVKRNVVSNRQITLGWQQCCVKMFQNWKKKLTCRRRRLITGRWGGVRGALMNNTNIAEGGVSEPVGGASEPVGGANESVGGLSNPVGGANINEGGTSNSAETNTVAATTVATNNSTSNKAIESKNPETARAGTGDGLPASSTAAEEASKAESCSSSVQVTNTTTTATTVSTASAAAPVSSTASAGSVMEDWWGKIKNLTIGSTASETGNTASTSITPVTTTTTTTASSSDRTTTITTSPATTTTTTSTLAVVPSEGAGAATSSPEAPAVPPPLESEASLDSVLSLSEEDQQAQESVECVQERAELVILTFVAAPLFAFLFYGELWKSEELWRSLGFLSPAVAPVVLTHVLWLCLAVDYLARLCTVWVKACLCLVLLCRSGTSVLSKGKYYPVLEMLSQLYRCLLPVHPWFLYLCNYYDASTEASSGPRFDPSRSSMNDHLNNDGDGVTPFASATTIPMFRDRSTPSSYQFWGIALFIVYLLNKKVDVATNAVNLWQAFKALRANTGSYGTAPSKSEIENSGGKCPICHDPFKGPTLLTCSHIFCEGCIVQWFQRERICPMCRAQIADDPLWKDGATSQLPQII